MKNNEEFKKIKCTIGTRWTTGFDTQTGKQKPNSKGKVVPTHNMTLYDVVESYLFNKDYRNSCEQKANKYNEEHELSPNDSDYRKGKFYASSIYSFNDYRYTKYDDVLIDDRYIKTLTNKSFLEHTGLMGFDIDFPKDINNLDEVIKDMKLKLYKELCKYDWFCMITLSTGGKGLHIYTYNEVPEYYNKTDKDNSERIAYFNSCYQYKSYFIYKAIHTCYPEYTFEYIFSLLDFAMYKPEQTINITVFDNDPFINEKFKCSLCVPVIKNIEAGYDNWIHKEGNSLKPDAEAGYVVFNEMYCNIGKFIGNDSYSITKQAIFNTCKKKNYKPSKEGPFYFGHNERHNGIPTMHEICRYLLATRTYEEANMIVSDKNFYNNSDDFPRLLKWYNSRDVKYIPSEYVNQWLNTFAGFNDELVWDEIDIELVNYFSGFIRDNKGRIDRDNIDNYIYYLNNYPLYKNKFKFNTLSHRNEYYGKTFANGEAKDYSLSDIDWTLIRNNFNRHLHFLNKNLVEEAVNEICNNNKYNPVIDYLNSLEWDGVERIETMFTTWLGAKDCKLYRRYAKLWMYAAVKRIFEPGSKWDNILILYGKQGDGKTEFFKRLGKEWNTSNRMNLTNKDYINRLNKNWIVIMDELASLNKKEMDEVKSFFTNQDDEDRLAFAKEAKKFYRHCIFCGTTNSKGILRDLDDMYERRFWIIEVNAISPTYVYNNFKEEDVDKLWAEAVHMYKEDPFMNLYIGEEYMEDAKEDQIAYKSFNNDDDIEFLKTNVFDAYYSFNINSPTWHGSYIFSSYEDFKKQVLSDSLQEDDGISTINTKVDMIPVAYIRNLLLDLYKVNKSSKYISFAVEWEVKPTKVNGKMMKVYHRII